LKELFSEHPTFAKAFLVTLFILAINALTKNALVGPTGTGLTILHCSKNFKSCTGLIANGIFYWNIFVISIISLLYDLLISKSHRILFMEDLIGGALGSLLLSAVAVLSLFAYIPLFIIMTILMLIAFIIGNKVHKGRVKQKS
jgi:hypothetical protein